MDETDVKRMLDKIERISQCPVCLDVVKPPVAQCANGHVSCGQCKEQLRECSVCRGPFIATINRIVEELLNSLPKQCPYADKGCKALTILDNHTQYCEYRPMKCLLGNNRSCTWSGSVNEWKEHSNQQHPTPKATYSFGQQTNLIYTNMFGDWHCRTAHHCIDEENFLVFTRKSEDKLCLTLRHVEYKKPKQEFLMKIKFANDDDNILYKSLLISKPLREDESIEANPIFFLLSDLKGIITGEDLNVEVEALQVDLPENI